MPYSRKRKTYSRRGAVGTAAALNRVARAMYQATPIAQEKAKRIAIRRLFRRGAAVAANANPDIRGQIMASAKNTLPNSMAAFLARYPNTSQDEIMRLVGRGGYWGRKIGGWLGGLTGNSTIKGWGEQIGDYAGDLVADKIPGGGLVADAAANWWKARGTGAYDIGPGPSVQPGTFAAGDVEQVHLQHREFLGPVNGSAAFNLTELLLNPGAAQTFPQLSRIAMFYEQYRFNGLIFWYHSTSGESTNSADTAIGEVMMANMPDSTEQSPINKQQLVRLDMAKQAKPSIDQAHGIECADAIVKYIRHGDKSEATQDATRFDMGKFFIGTEGMNASTTRIGELWVTYDVTLIRSRDSKGAEVMCAHYVNTAATSTNLFQGLGMTQKYDNIGIIVGPTTNRIVFPQYINDGDYMLTIRLDGAALGDSAFNCRSPAASSLSNCSLLGIDGSTGTGQYVSSTAASGDISTNNPTMQIAIRINAPGSSQAYVSFDNLTRWGNGGTTGALYLQITRIPQGFM